MGNSQARPPNDDERQTLYEVRMTLDFTHGGVAPQRPEQGPDPRQAALLERLSTVASRGNDEEEGFGCAAPPWPVPSADWAAIGFQGPDPRLDLRGHARLSLEQLCFLFESPEHGHWARQASRWLSAGLDDGGTSFLPFCVVSMAATAELAAAMGVIPRDRVGGVAPPPTPGGGDEPTHASSWMLLRARAAYDAAYAAVLRCLVAEWLPPRGPGEYMDFGRARAAVSVALAQALRAGPRDARDLAALLGVVSLDGRWAPSAQRPLAAMLPPTVRSPQSRMIGEEQAVSEVPRLRPQMEGLLRHYPAGWEDVPIGIRAFSSATRKARRGRWRLLSVRVLAPPLNGTGGGGVVEWHDRPSSPQAGADGFPVAAESSASPSREPSPGPEDDAGFSGAGGAMEEAVMGKGRLVLTSQCRAHPGLADGSYAEGYRFLTLFPPGDRPSVLLRAERSEDVPRWLWALGCAGAAVAHATLANLDPASRRAVPGTVLRSASGALMGDSLDRNSQVQRY